MVDKESLNRIEPEVVIGDKDEIFEKIISVQDWLEAFGTNRPFFINLVLRELTTLMIQRFPDINISDIVCVYGENDGRKGQYFANKDHYRSSYKYLLDNISKLQNIFEQFGLESEKYELFYEKFSFAKNKIDLFDEFIKIYDDWYVVGCAVDGALVYSEELVKKFKDKYSDYEEEISILVLPDKLTFIGEENLSMMKIAFQSKKLCVEEISDFKSDNDLMNLLKEHQKRFHWIRNNYRGAYEITVEQFLEELPEYLDKDMTFLQEKIEQQENYELTHSKKVDLIKSKNIFSEKEFQDLIWVGKTSFLMDKRKGYNLLGDYMLSEFLKGFANKLNLDYDDLAMLTDLELKEILSGAKSLNNFNIVERKKATLSWYDTDGNHLLYNGDNAKQFMKEIKPIYDTTGPVKGLVASKGFTKGRVRIIYDTSQNHDFKEGDILVTGMTRPEFVPLMKKAGAIITDEGGVTCHAAIISRELGKPCIIGTKNATSALKDGDLIEVDANKGIVRKIE